MEQLRGRNALITGAAGGLGEYIARSLASEGVNLVLSDLAEAGLEQRAAQLRGSTGVTVETVSADLSRRDDAKGLFSRAEDALGPIDILVNNAGLEFAGPFAEMSEDELTALIDVNLTATMLLTRSALPEMLRRGRGHVVNLGSVAGKLPATSLAAYAASKHGVVGFTNTLRSEHGDGPVGFSVVCPGFVARAGMYGRVETGEDPPPPFRPVQPEQVAAAVVTAIRENRAQTIVNGRGIGPLIVLATLAPGMFARLSRGDRAKQFAERFRSAKAEAPDTPAERKVHASSD